MKKPLISIIIPIYNVEEYLADCINSIITQDFNEYEIIAVNDGSTDNSLEVCKALAKDNEHIKIINQINKGLSEARNSGIREAVGDYLMFVDSDDFLEEKSLLNISKHIKDFSTDVIIGLLYKYYDEKKVYSESFRLSNEEVIRYDKETLLSELFQDISWPVQKYIVKRKLVLDNDLRFKPGCLHEDVDWTTRLFLVADSFSFYDIPFYYHRMNRTGSITNTYNSKRGKDVIIIVGELIDLINTKYVDSRFKDSIRSRLSKSTYYYVSTIYFFKGEERESLLSLIENNIEVLKYTKKSSQRIFYKCIKMIGLRPTIKLSFYIRKLINIGR